MASHDDDRDAPLTRRNHSPACLRSDWGMSGVALVLATGQCV